jgi:DNA-directed RNA polymerase
MVWAERLLARGRPFWTEMYCDFRGRVYAFPHFNYGRGDYVRALFRLHHGAPITDRGIFWLKVATANRYNEGKNTEHAITRLSLEDRAQWTDDHLNRIRALADDPMSGLLHRAGGYWLEKADDPFQFLAHCIELTRALKTKNFKTTLPISFDASNSGAQHYSLLGRDAEGARPTNLTPGKIEDLYLEVLSAIQRRFTVLMDEAKKGAQTEECRWAMWLRSREGFIERKTFKMLIVAFLYGQQERGTEKKILKALGVKRDDLHPGLLDWFVDLVREAMEKALPGATKIMGFTRDIAGMLADAGKTLWMHSPTGVPVCNLEYKPDLQRPKLWLENKPMRHWAVVDDLDEIDVAACMRGAAANLVHSLDASHLALVALACECAGIPLACVHDCFGTLACHVDELREILLRELRAMYENIDPLQDIYDRARVALGPMNRTWPIVPSRGSLDLGQVNGPYAFS